VVRRLAGDTRGNVLAIIAASLFPLLGLLGGGIERHYTTPAAFAAELSVEALIYLCSAVINSR
jgi:hypothetical protein